MPALYASLARGWSFAAILASLTACASPAPIAPTAVGSERSTLPALEPTAILPPTKPPTAGATSTVRPTAAPDPASELDTYLGGLTAMGSFSGAVLVARDGEILYRRGFGYADRSREIANDPESLFPIGDITSQFTASLILQLQDRELLSVQDPVCAHLDRCPEAWQSITIHQLLTHQSGIPEYTNQHDFDTYRTTPATPIELMGHFSDRSLLFEPGLSWKYSCSDYVVLGAVIEALTGQSYGDAVRDNITAPLGLLDTIYRLNATSPTLGYARRTDEPVVPDDTSVGYAALGLSSTVDDLFYWVQALEAHSLLSVDSQTQMFAPHVSIPGGSGWAFGYGSVVGLELNRPAVESAGLVNGFASALTWFTEDHIVIVVLANQQDINATGITVEIGKILLTED